MINEYQFNSIVKNKLIKKIKYNYLNYSYLKNYINKIYNNFDLPRESFIIALYYLKKCTQCTKCNVKLYLLSSIIIANKQLLDDRLNLVKIYTFLNVNIKDEQNKEIEFLKLLNWNTYYNTEEYDQFKKYLVHHTDLLHILN